jgi:hypothetical protein
MKMTNGIGAPVLDSECCDRAVGAARLPAPTSLHEAKRRTPGARPDCDGATKVKPRLLDQVREAVRARHYSIRTEHTYCEWVTRYVMFHGKRHPKEMGPAEINRFLTHLACDRNVAAGTQNQALSALVFLYRSSSGMPFRR